MNTPLPIKKPATVGYLTVTEHTPHGYFGGYLILDMLGRPLEFHCTAPVLPSRAQEILYGPALGPFLLGEQIGGSLLAVAKLKPSLLLIDQVDLAVLSYTHALPLIRLVGQTTTSNATMLAGQGIEIQPGAKLDEPTIIAQLTQFVERVELDEPFERIRLAIREAGQIGNSQEPGHVEAA